MPSYTYENLIRWSRGQLSWQRDLLRRLLTSGEATDSDISELADLACPTVSPAADGLPSPILATEDHVRAKASDLPVVQLEKICDIVRVNALAEGPVWFGPDGLTVVYGDNGAGKSGLARILKKACRARDPGGEVLSNVFDEPATEPPAATIAFRVNGKSRTYEWVEGEAPDSVLSTVHVFDARCAALQVEQANLISYTPALVKIFQELADATLRVRSELQRRKAVLGGRPKFLSTLDLGPGTAAGRFIGALSKDSDEEALAAIATLSEAESKHLKLLNRALRDDPGRAAQLEEARARKLREIEGLLAQTFATLSDDVLDRFEQAIEEQTEARAAATAAQLEFNRNSRLDGLGGEEWRRLWEAARRYSEAHAYPAGSFPVTSDAAYCVLCQQTLSDETQTRMHSFEEFVQSDLQRGSDEAHEVVQNMIAEVSALELPSASRATVADVGPLSEPVGRQVRKVLICGRLRRRYMLGRSRGSDELTRPALPTRPSLAALIATADQEVSGLQAASRAGDRANMMAERTELSERKIIAPHVEAIKAEITRLRSVELAEQAAEACRTTGITLQGGKAAKAIITDRLRTSFTANLLDVGFSGTPVEMQLGAGEYGEHPYETRLMPQPEVPPERVLSEGEKTCVALAGLLAELETTGNTSALVLDDPVSSLDHQYRKRMAERLVKEANTRQVIVLTHDVVFLYLLRKYSQEMDVVKTEITMHRGHRGNHGVTTEGPPWFAMGVRHRISRLRNDLVEARRVLSEGDWDDYQYRGERLYKNLRETWERAVEEVLLNQTVLRFGDSVQTNRLAKLTDIEDSDIQTVTREISRLSDFVHDEAGVLHTDIPYPDVVEADIRHLDDWVKTLRKDRGRS